MPSVNSNTGYGFNNTSRRTYISLAAFNNDFFTYTTSINDQFQTVGDLSVVTENASLTPKGRILRENGKKLVPGAYPGVDTFMVGVYDDLTFLNGFIDPNSPIFTPVNTDKPNYLNNGVDPGPGGQTDLAPPVYTRGKVIAEDSITTESGLYVADGIDVSGSVISGSGQIYVNESPTIASFTTGGNTASFNAALSQVWIVNSNCSGSASNSIDVTGVSTGMRVTIIIIFGASGANDTIVFGTNIREATTTLVGTNDTAYTVSFIGYGNTLYETGRSGALQGN
jgi:hypothetical protein